MSKLKIIRLSKGFTLIELIVVIVVIAILSVIALPRFINLTTQSQQAQIDGIAAQFGSAVSFAQKQWIVNGATPASQVDLEGYGDGKLDVNDIGFPIGIDKGNSEGEMSNPYQIGKNEKGCIEIWNQIVDGDYSLSININDAANVDFIAARKNLSFTASDGTSHDQKAVCYYASTVRRAGNNPESWPYIIWYNSRNGVVSTTRPDGV
ncbi:prepilin-type N-terminal cleavage/methylation domain-containing protein [Vibrio maerlii]|uniref:prepilin-type N-terminal cleavage/methylation domain-containing protein n=1 Tax=Vibrio maerlii TaxID=2231648 RepID=UPI000E3BAACA|nr:prepilin-type N-terminal cleavage/methylation domain-containing protein [Vibrio maerlii]